MSNLITKYKSKYPWITGFQHFKGANVYIGEVDPSLLPPNPKNWRIHSQRQRATYKAFKEKYGWLGVCIFNLASGKLLDGHLRVDEALKAGEDLIPIIVVDLAEDGENEVLATLDNIGLLAQRNEEALKSLTKSVDQALGSVRTETDRKLKQLRKDLQEAEFGTQPVLKQASSRLRPVSPSPPPEEEAEAEESISDAYESPFDPNDTVRTYVNANILFDGLTDMGIPELSRENLATPDLVPTCTFPTDPLESAYHCYSQTFDGTYSPGAIGFYTEDNKFEAVYSQVDSFIDWLQEIQPKVLIGPDFSCYTLWPVARNIYNLYRNRWCTRLWQELGFKVIPSIQILDGPPYTLTTRYSLETLPQKATLSIECRLDDPKEHQILSNWINHIIKVCKPECLMLYAGEEKQKYILGDLKKSKTQLIFLPQIATVKRKRNFK
jgi:hypothetical protein